MTVPRQQEFRQLPRSLISCPVTVEAGNRILHGETLNLGPSGAKRRLDERPMDVEAIVWRGKDDGPIFSFTKAIRVGLQPSQ